jgi:hypothetical protein
MMEETIKDTMLPTMDAFPSKAGSIPFWDHPNMTGHRLLPDDYFPFTKSEFALEAYYRGKLDEEDITILKVVGDAIAANEDQLRRYLSRKMSRSVLSARLQKMRKNGYVDRWRCRLAFDEEEVHKPPAPFTLGIAGYKLLTYLYAGHSFMNPNTLDTQNVKMIQRYVAMNELRCLLVEARVLRGWEWNVMIGKSKRFLPPLGVATVQSPKGLINFLVERPQMSQNFIGYLKSKLEQYRTLYEKQGAFVLNHIEPHQSVIILFTSTLSMAERIHEEVKTHLYPFTIWFAVEEFIDEEEGVSPAFLSPDGKSLKRFSVPFLQKRAAEPLAIVKKG